LCYVLDSFVIFLTFILIMMLHDFINFSLYYLSGSCYSFSIVVFLVGSCITLETLQPGFPVLFTSFLDTLDHTILNCRTNFTFTKCILPMSLVLQCVLAHICLHEEVDIMLSNGHMPSSGSLHSCYNTVKCSTDSFTTTMKTPYWWHMWCAKTCCRIDNVWSLHLLHVEVGSTYQFVIWGTVHIIFKYAKLFQFCFIHTG
jgi:hypothetical protein